MYVIIVFLEKYLNKKNYFNNKEPLALRRRK